MKLRGRNARIGAVLLLSILLQTLNIFIRGVMYPVRVVIKYLTEGKNTLTDCDNGEDIPVEVISMDASKGCPEFSEVHNLPGGFLLGIEYITRVPDETAVVRILSEDSFSKQYKRKVYTTRGIGTKYIKIDNKRIDLKKTKVYLD